MSDIEVKNLSIGFNEKQIFNNFSRIFKSGIITNIMGPSGCGKTTLLRILMGLESTYSGEVSGVPRKISAVFQEDRLSEDFSVLSNIRMVTGKTVSVDIIKEHLSELGLLNELRTPVKNLSGGMKRRVAIARAVLYDADVIFLDEAFKGLDGETKKQTMDYFHRHTKDKTVIAVTHERTEAEYLGGEILELHL